MNKNDGLEKLLWGIALPGFGQILNGELIKGLFFIILEIVINMRANLNNIIISSFLGDLELAVKEADYQWLMFYPCFYLFVIWDGYKNSDTEKKEYSFLPFVSAAMLGTIGVIYSPIFRIRGILFGPIWLPLIFFGIGIAVGNALKFLLFKFKNKKELQ